MTKLSVTYRATIERDVRITVRVRPTLENKKTSRALKQVKR